MIEVASVGMEFGKARVGFRVFIELDEVEDAMLEVDEIGWVVIKLDEVDEGVAWREETIEVMKPLNLCLNGNHSGLLQLG